MTKQSQSTCHAPRAGPKVMICGFLMGTADAVPGVSGGTVALVLGIYDKLVTAISHFDATWIRLVSQRDWRAARERVQLGFLLQLVIGIAAGLVATLSSVNYLLSHSQTRPFTLAVFFGLILASTVLVARIIQWQSSQQRTACLGLVLCGAAISYWLTTLHNAHYSDPSLKYLFGCGSIAICAMILPGISGAMILWILGIYEYLSDLPHLLIGGNTSLTALLQLTAFASGCLLGLLAFSRLLRYLLATHRAFTMSVLCGVMLGALNKLWPFQVAEATAEHALQITRNVLPTKMGLHSGTVILSAVAAALLVLWIDRYFQQKTQPTATPLADGSE